MIPGKEVLLQGDENAFSGQRCEELIQQWLKEIKQILHETDHLLSLTYPKRTSINYRQEKQPLSCWPFLSFKRGSNWVPSFEVYQMMGLLKLISTFLHAGTSMKRVLGTQPCEMEKAGNLRGCGITEGRVDPLCQLQQ